MWCSVRAICSGAGADLQRLSMRCRRQVETFYLILSALLPPAPSLPPLCANTEADTEARAPPTPSTVVDFGSGSGNLTLPLAALMP